MSLILKIMYEPDSVLPNASVERCHGLFGDITSIHFQRQPDGSVMAHCYVREPIKTAESAGFCEVEKWIDVAGTCYVLNESGRTVSTFVAPTREDLARMGEQREAA